MKGYKALAPIVLAACMVLSFYMLFSARSDVANEYNTYLANARDFAKQGIMVDALENYASAMNMENTLDINLEVGNFYVEMDEHDSAIGWGEMMIESFPTSAEAYEFLLERYRANNDFNRCYALYDIIVRRELVTEKVSSIMNGIKYVYYFGEAFDDVGVFSEGYCAVQFEGQWGLVNEIGERFAPYRFRTVGPFIDGYSPVTTDEGEAFFIDNEGNKKKILQVEGEVVDLSPMVGEVYAVYNGTTWAFYDLNDKKISGDYKNISLRANTVVAVETDENWQILNESFQSVSADSYTDVIQDDRGIIYCNGVIFVNQNGGYYMVDATGKQICDKKFTDARLFLDNTYAAVKTEKGWTFVNAAGEFVFQDLYFDDARSFANGFAAVSKNGMWGYIDMEGNVAVDYQFSDAKDFNASGCAFVKNEGIWVLLRLYSKNYES